ncbi:MAG TPA: hypothetical protein VFX16_29305 [Pseudonocardiaceae bacterium]|nr:hypothetical protein [Pseudonocardiaceae bacterium]
MSVPVGGTTSMFSAPRQQFSVALPPFQSVSTHCERGSSGAVRLWDVTDPALCDVLVTMDINGQRVHEAAVRTGFRQAEFTDDGFFLNGRRLTLFGVNRHQWYPFVGGAMPDRVQRRGRDDPEGRAELHDGALLALPTGHRVPGRL